MKMNVKTCAYEQCGQVFGAPNARQIYCSRKCSSNVHRDSSGRQCSKDECGKPERARGLCSGHYNADRRAAGIRTPKIQVECGQCGKLCWKDNAPARNYSARFCSAECRNAWVSIWRTNQRVCKVPDSHPGMVAIRADWKAEYQAQLDEWARRRQAKKRAVHELMRPRACEDCGQTYTPGTTVQRYCSMRCVRRVSRRARKALEYKANGTFRWSDVIRLFLNFERCCAYCLNPINGQPDPDHVLALSRGGHNTISNILPSCRPCNTDKNDMTLDEWAVDRQRRGLPVIIAELPDDPRYNHVLLQRPTRPSRVGRPAA